MLVKRTIKLFIFFVIAVLSNIIVWNVCSINYDDVKFSVEIQADREDVFQIFYSDDGEFKEENSIYFQYDKPNSVQNIELPWNLKNNWIRVDIGNNGHGRTEISEAALNANGKKFNIDMQRLADGRNFEDHNTTSVSETSLSTEHFQDDPHFVYEITDNELKEIKDYQISFERIIKIFVCLVVDLIFLILAIKRNLVYSLINELWHSKNLIWSLSKNDFKTKYAGSSLGIIWAFVQPIVTVLVYLAVFQFGLKSTSPVEDLPYVIWFVSGMIPWFFFSDALNNATNCFIEYSYLVKKIIFKISILPIVKVISSFFVHLVFLGFLAVLCFIYNIMPTIFTLQVVYYVFCMLVFVTAVSFLTSAIIVFFRDLGQIINIILQIGMWATPIVWPSTIVPSKFQWIVKLNPIFYIVEGYRDAFSSNGIWFYNKYFQTIYFWAITGIMLILGSIVFKRLRNHFSDVL